MGVQRKKRWTMANLAGTLAQLEKCFSHISMVPFRQ
jgi:hypothetical protein